MFRKNVKYTSFLLSRDFKHHPLNGNTHQNIPEETLLLIKAPVHSHFTMTKKTKMRIHTSKLWKFLDNQITLKQCQNLLKHCFHSQSEKIVKQ